MLDWVTRGLVWTMGGVTTLGIMVTVALTVGPRVLPYQTYWVLSGSMEPTIPAGSVIILLPATNDQLAVGDVITFERPDQPGALVTHRIVGTEKGELGPVFVTKGDANPSPDSWRVRVVGDGSNLLVNRALRLRARLTRQGWSVGPSPTVWRYRFGVPYAGYILHAMQTALGRWLLVVLPALGLGVIGLVEIWRPRRPTAIQAQT